MVQSYSIHKVTQRTRAQSNANVWTSLKQTKWETPPKNYERDSVTTATGKNASLFWRYGKKGPYMNARFFTTAAPRSEASPDVQSVSSNNAETNSFFFVLSLQFLCSHRLYVKTVLPRFQQVFPVDILIVNVTGHLLRLIERINRSYDSKNKMHGWAIWTVQPARDKDNGVYHGHYRNANYGLEQEHIFISWLNSVDHSSSSLAWVDVQGIFRPLCAPALLAL